MQKSHSTTLMSGTKQVISEAMCSPHTVVYFSQQILYRRAVDQACLSSQRPLLAYHLPSDITVSGTTVDPPLGILTDARRGAMVTPTSTTSSPSS